MTTKQPYRRLSREIAEMAEAQRRLGIMDEATHEKITTRHMGTKALPKVVLPDACTSARASALEPGSAGALSEHDHWLRVATRTRRGTAQGGGLVPVERHPAQGH